MCVCVFISRKSQQYDCKWYIPLSDLTFQTIEDSEATPIPQVQEEEIDAMKIRISQIKNELQREKVTTDVRQRGNPCSVITDHFIIIMLKHLTRLWLHNSH